MPSNMDITILVGFFVVWFLLPLIHAAPPLQTGPMPNLDDLSMEFANFSITLTNGHFLGNLPCIQTTIDTACRRLNLFRDNLIFKHAHQGDTTICPIINEYRLCLVNALCDRCATPADAKICSIEKKKQFSSCSGGYFSGLASMTAGSIFCIILATVLAGLALFCLVKCCCG